MACRKARHETSLHRLVKVARTHTVLTSLGVPQRGTPKGETPPGFSQRENPGGVSPKVYTKYEPQGFSASTLKRSATIMKSLPSEKSGIKFHAVTHNSVVLLHESHMTLLYTYQLCRDAYNSAEVKIAKQCYHKARRFFSHWESIYGNSIIVRRWMRVISITLRLAESAAVQPGCSLRERHGNAMDLCRTSATGLILRGECHKV